MKTRRIKGNNRENTGIPTVFVTFDGVTYILCQDCGNPMLTSNLYVWKEDKAGKPYGLHLIHYRCLEFFEATHEGKWSKKGMLSVKMILNSK